MYVTQCSDMNIYGHRTHTALPIISSGKNAQDVVEVMAGFVQSAYAGHVPVQLPLERLGGRLGTGTGAAGGAKQQEEPEVASAAAAAVVAAARL